MKEQSSGAARKPVVRKTDQGETYNSMDGWYPFTLWMFWEDDTRDAKVVRLRLRLVASDGTRILPAAEFIREIR